MVANLSNEKPSLQTVQMFDNGSDNYKDWTINYQAVSETSLTFVEAYFTTLNGATIYRDTDFDGVLEYHSGGDTLGNYRLQRFTLVEEDGSYDDIYNIPSDVDANVFEQFAEWMQSNTLIR